MQRASQPNLKRWSANHVRRQRETLLGQTLLSLSFQFFRRKEEKNKQETDFGALPPMMSEYQTAVGAAVLRPLLVLTFPRRCGSQLHCRCRCRRRRRQCWTGACSSLAGHIGPSSLLPHFASAPAPTVLLPHAPRRCLAARAQIAFVPAHLASLTSVQQHRMTLAPRCYHHSQSPRHHHHDCGRAEIGAMP